MKLRLFTTIGGGMRPIWLKNASKRYSWNKLGKNWNNWKDKVSTQHGACRWLKQTEPVSCVLRDNQGNMITDRSALTQELRTCWSQIFGVNAQSLGVDNFWQTFGPYMPARAPSPVLSKITCADIQQAAQKMSKRATGLDGLAAQHISSLPHPALIRLAQLLLFLKGKAAGRMGWNIGRWSLSLNKNRIVFPRRLMSGQSVLARWYTEFGVKSD